MTLVPLVVLFVKEKMTRKATDLTYSTIMSIVPILAIIFAIAKGFGMEDMMWVQIERLIGAGDIMDQILMSVSKSVDMTRASSGWIFGIALLTLMYTANNALCKLEDIFNEIWNVEGRRGWFSRLPYNMFFLLLLPVAILMIGAITGQVESAMNSYVSFADWVIRCFIVSLMFILLYKMLPETYVMWRGAIISGIIAGIGITVWHFFYLMFQNQLFNYNKVYGSFAAIPFFLIWTMVSWSICLIGAKFNMVFQQRVLTHGWVLNADEKIEQMSARDKLQVVITVASCAVKSFAAGKEITTTTLVSDSSMSGIYVGYALGVLRKSGVMHFVTTPNSDIDVYYPSIPMAQMTVGQLVQIIYTSGTSDALDTHGAVSDCVDDVLRHVVKASDMKLVDM